MAMTKTKLSRALEQTILHLILGLGLVIAVAPFFWMLSTSFKSGGGIFKYPPQILPHNPTLQWYFQLFRDVDFFLHFKNSLIVAVTTTVFQLFLSSLAGYAFAKLRFAGRDRIFTLLMATLMIPGQITMIPVFLFLKQLGLLNTYWGLILPTAVGVFGIFLIRQFMLTVPDDLIEASRIDGCSEFRIYWSVVLPLCKPVLATLGIFTFMGSWNDFLLPLIVMMGEDRYTLPVALANLNSQNATKFGLLMAGAVVVVIPVILIFAFAQKYVIRGIATTGLKE